MMQMLMNEEFVEQLRTARTPQAFLDAIDKQEEAQFGSDSFTDQSIPQDGFRVLAVTACPNGIAHTYMAAEALTKAGTKLELPVKVETNGSDGAKNILTREEIAPATASSWRRTRTWRLPALTASLYSSPAWTTASTSPKS